MEDFEFPTVTLSSGLAVALHPSWKKFDGRPLTVEVIGPRGGGSQVELPYPSAGLGGGRFVVSPSERLVVLSMFSGQSEEGYDVFSVTPELQRIGGMEYVFGELSAFTFSPDESQLITAIPETCSEWWNLWEIAEPDVDPSRRTFDFAHLYAHDLRSSVITGSTIRVSAPASWIPPEAPYDADLAPVFVTVSQVRLSTPWGQVVVPFPLPSEVVIDPEK